MFDAIPNMDQVAVFRAAARHINAFFTTSTNPTDLTAWPIKRELLFVVAMAAITKLDTSTIAAFAIFHFDAKLGVCFPLDGSFPNRMVRLHTLHVAASYKWLALHV